MYRVLQRIWDFVLWGFRALDGSNGFMAEGFKVGVWNFRASFRVCWNRNPKPG